jgi:hypothetical protein
MLFPNNNNTDKTNSGLKKETVNKHKTKSNLNDNNKQTII